MLQSIYMTEMNVLDEERLLCEIKILPNGAGSQDNEVAAYLKIGLGGSYPETEPEWAIRDAFGLSRTQMDELRGVVADYVKEQLGSQLAFGLVEVIREWLLPRNVAPWSSAAATEAPKVHLSFEESEAQLLAELEAECKDGELGGTLVTDESFAAWLASFTAEMERNGTPLLPKKEKTALTGRQLFEQGVANEADLEE